MRSDRLESVLRPVGPAGTPAAREAAADVLTRGRWRPDPERILFAGNGRQAISAAVAALTRPGARLGVEEFTYPVLKAIAARIGVTLVPLAMDGDGLIPEAVEEAHRADPLHAVYVQPVLHNPLSLTMPARRLDRLADVLLSSGIDAIEDAVWAFLRDDVAPLASRAPERTVLVDSLSKRLSPGLSLGFAVAPAAAAGRVAGALRSGGWTPMRFPLEAMAQWQADGAVDVLVRAKRREAGVRQEIAHRHLGGFRTCGDPFSYYRWWELPSPWRADTFVAAAARQGIAVTPARRSPRAATGARRRSASAWRHPPWRPSPGPSRPSPTSPGPPRRTSWGSEGVREPHRRKCDRRDGRVDLLRARGSRAPRSPPGVRRGPSAGPGP